MKKLLLLIIAIASLLSLMGCGSDKHLPDTCEHPNFITGKIIEIKDSNTILIQITKERGGFKIDDKVLINFKRLTFIPPDGNNREVKPALNDEVNAQFWPDELKKKDGYNYIEVDSVEKYE